MNAQAIFAANPTAHTIAFDLGPARRFGVANTGSCVLTLQNLKPFHLVRTAKFESRDGRVFYGVVLAEVYDALRFAQVEPGVEVSTGVLRPAGSVQLASPGRRVIVEGGDTFLLAKGRSSHAVRVLLPE